MRNALDMGDNEEIIDIAKRFYRVCVLLLEVKIQYGSLHRPCELFCFWNCFPFVKIAIERNFTRGRKSEQVQAACLYIACR